MGTRGSYKGNMSTLREAFIDELKDLYDAEKQLLKALPRMAKAAQNEELQSAFEEHETQTQEHLSRLENVFEALGEAAKGKRCKGMAGLIEEATELIKEKEGDAALIAAAQKAEHYEISAYGTLSAWAEALQEQDIIDLLEETLGEEKDTDEKLTSIAESVVNEMESEEEEGEDEEEEEPKPRSKAKKPAAKKKKR